MLCHKQLYESKFDAAMRTALVLTDYEEFLPALEIYLLLGNINMNCSNLQLFLALSSCQAKQFAVCSRAFMKIESLPHLTPEENEQYTDLALKIFLK
jgi:WD repeat-containing protein 35